MLISNITNHFKVFFSLYSLVVAFFMTWNVVTIACMRTTLDHSFCFFVFFGGCNYDHMYYGRFITTNLIEIMGEINKEKKALLSYK